MAANYSQWQNIRKQGRDQHCAELGIASDVKQVLVSTDIRLATSVHSGTVPVLCGDESQVLSCSGCNEEQEYSFFEHAHENMPNSAPLGR